MPHDKDTLTMLEWIFVAEYVKDWNATAAMRRCAEQGVYEGHYPAQDGSKIFRTPRVAAEIAKCKKAIIDAIELNVADVVNDIKTVLHGDTREITDVVRDCCRYCHGDNHEYQFTINQWRKMKAKHETTDDYLYKGILLDPQGGVGFDPRKDPHPDCPECHGRGELTIVGKDTRYMSPTAVAMYMGAKPTKHGIEVMTRSKDSARESAAKWLGMHKSEINLVSNVKAKDMTDDQLAAFIAQGAKT